MMAPVPVSPLPVVHPIFCSQLSVLGPSALAYNLESAAARLSRPWMLLATACRCRRDAASSEVERAAALTFDGSIYLLYLRILTVFFTLTALLAIIVAAVNASSDGPFSDVLFLFATSRLEQSR